MKSQQSWVMIIAALIGIMIIYKQIVSVDTGRIALISNQNTVPEEQVIDDSAIIILGKTIDEPVDAWNQNSGERWSMDSERTDVKHPPAAFPIQRLWVDVGEVWRAEEIVVPDVLEIIVIGNEMGKRWSKNVAALPGGSEVIVFLSRKTIGWRDGPDGRLDVTTFSNSFNSLYIIESGGRIKNAADVQISGREVDPERSDTLRELRDRVTREDRS